MTGTGLAPHPTQLVGRTPARVGFDVPQRVQALSHSRDSRDGSGMSADATC